MPVEASLEDEPHQLDFVDRQLRRVVPALDLRPKVLPDRHRRVLPEEVPDSAKHVRRLGKSHPPSSASPAPAFHILARLVGYLQAIELQVRPNTAHCPPAFSFASLPP